MLKAAFVLIGLTLACAQSQANDNCSSEAVRAVKESGFSTSIFYSIEPLEPSRDYLVKYEVVLTDKLENPTKFESYEVTLMRSDCTVTSLVPEI